MKKKILIVTDNAAAQASLAETLNAQGYATLHTETAARSARWLKIRRT